MANMPAGAKGYIQRKFILA